MRGFLSKYGIADPLTLPLDFVFKWLATALLIVSAVLTSGNWLYPINVILCLLGNLLWAVVGWMWKEFSLVVLSVILTVIYLGGMIIHYLT